MSADELAQRAADRVREVIAEAERRAEEIIGEAEREAARIRARTETPDPRPPSPVPEPPVPEPPPPAPTPPEPEPTPGLSSVNGTSGDQAAIRLLAMKLALEGKDRDQIASELEAKFGPAERGPLLDEILARATTNR